MIRFKSIIVCAGVTVLLGACSRAQVEDQDLAGLAPEPAPAQTWEPFVRPAQDPFDDRPNPGAEPGQLPGQPAGRQTVKAGFPEGALTARQPPVPDEILAAEMSAADAVAAQRHALSGPPQPGMLPSPTQGRAPPASPPPASDVETGNQ